jgi:hypothetical protein
MYLTMSAARDALREAVGIAGRPHAEVPGDVEVGPPLAAWVGAWNGWTCRGRSGVVLRATG